jgi:hypothetical protein
MWRCCQSEPGRERGSLGPRTPRVVPDVNCSIRVEPARGAASGRDVRDENSVTFRVMRLKVMAPRPILLLHRAFGPIEIASK